MENGIWAMKDFDRRTLKDRRKRHTPGLSMYTFFGRRKGFRRKRDQELGGYIDRYNPRLFFILVAILGLNVLDAIFTMVILDYQGVELNPVTRSAIEVYGEGFWVWKYGIVSVCLLLLCLHSKFKRVGTIIVGIGSIYVVVVLYQIFLVAFRLP